MMKCTGLIFILACALSTVQASRQTVNPGAAILLDFDKRVAEYQKLRKTVESKLPRLKQTPSAAIIAQHETELAQAIREARPSARQGDIFTPEISAAFRRLVGLAMQGQNAKRIKESLKRSEPV